jgi:hypothetical protein
MIIVATISVLIIAIGLLFMCIQMLVKKNGKFPNGHVSRNPAMRKRGIKCNQAQDFEARRPNPHAIPERR